MFVGIQFIGIFFGLIMIYLSYLYYKKKAYNFRSLVLWTIIWLAFISMVMAPESIYDIMQVLQIQRTADFFVMVGFLVYAVLIFYMYIIVKRNERKVENIIRAIAFEHRTNARQKGKKAQNGTKKRRTKGQVPGNNRKKA